MGGSGPRLERVGIPLVRVSKAKGRDDLISPELQLGAIEQYAKRKNIRLLGAVEALDESGSQEKSKWWKTLEGVVTRIEAREAQVVLVWKFSRAARHRRRWAVTVDRIEVAGGSLESATEDVDTSTSTGRLTRGMLAELAAWEAEVKGEGWKEVKQRRFDLGLADGQPRFGYVLQDGVYRKHPVEGDALIDGYERAVRDESFRSIGFRWNSQGLITRRGNLWTSQSVRTTLRSGFAAGLIRHGQQWKPGVHERIIDEQTWQAFLAARAAGPKQAPRRASRHLYSGLLRCAYCHGVLDANGSSGGRSPLGTSWRCHNYSVLGLDGCERGGVMAWAPAISKVIRDWLEAEEVGEQARYEQELARWRLRPQVDTTPLRRRLFKVESDLIVLAKKNLDGFYDDTTYLLLRADLLDTQRTLTKQLAEAQPQEPLQHSVRPVLDAWGVALPLEQRHLLTLVLSHIEVRKAPDSPKYKPIPLWVVK